MGIYLDNAATSFPKPENVLRAVYDFIKDEGATAGRGAYEKALNSDRCIYETRKLICNLFNHKNPSSVIFTSNVTEALNTAIRGILKENDHVITSSLEHNAVWRSLKTLERDKNISISTIPCTKEGYTCPSKIEKYIKENTSLIVFTHASNVLGTIQPIKEIGAIARKYKIPFLVDAAQTAGAYPIDIQNDNIDILAFTGHKSLLGPMGTGGFIINWDGNIKPLKAGGTGGDSSFEYQPDYLPNKFETGTPNVPGIVGLGEGIKFINKVGIENIIKKEKEIIDYALKKLEEVDDIVIYGPKNSEKIANVISFNIDGLVSEEIAYELDQEYNIMIRVGLHCAPTAHRVIGTEKIGTLRIGIGYFNEKSHIDMLVGALKDIAKKVRAY
ncbi:aminotransferase class V-fold PLP-dependent enzyme [Tepidibacter formicigenes]|uniref:cysteine desulfurase n=1 Tax=Tepidibacter formicigenes DSM 15518 TaxID=1123349 RepID=A0A1M6QU76_9FIRM|nr:aminotransferase class V-fold PLP-dependent enzyme [Tepidibacter formicigenes]SHK23660.1 cysteine desulfurase family protein [Tepidibacter formicigenes DSM 15518]